MADENEGTTRKSSTSSANPDKNPHITDNMPPPPVGQAIEGGQQEGESWADYLARQNRQAVVQRISDK